MPTSTRWVAMSSDISSDLKVRSPSFSCAIGCPCIEVEVSSSSRHGQRGSAFSTNSGSAKGSWSMIMPGACDLLPAV